MTSVGPGDEVEGKVEQSKGNVDQRIVEVGKVLQMFQLSRFLWSFVLEENFRVSRANFAV